MARRRSAEPNYSSSNYMRVSVLIGYLRMDRYCFWLIARLSIWINTIAMNF